MLLGIVACAITLTTSNVLGLGSDYRNDEPVGGTSAWPEGLKQLVNTTNRVHGFFVNAEDIIFFSGNATNLTEFIGDYSKIQGVEKHQLILHDGAGEAKSPWRTNGQPCDWKLYACPKSWLVQDAKAKSFVLEVHFWTGGKIALDQLTIPKNVEITGGCLKIFESITNGMTRAEVEKKLTMDGGLRGVSPVRFIDPGCPGFKISVEFNFKKDAADQNRAIFGKDNRVIRVSKPYVQRPFMD